MAFFAAALSAQGQVTVSGSVTDNGSAVTPGDYDPYTASGNVVIGATGPGGLDLGNSAFYARGRTLTFGTSATNTGSLTGSGDLRLDGADPTAFGQSGGNGGSFQFVHGTLNLTGGSIDLRGSPGANGSTTSGPGGRGGTGGTFSYSGSGGVINGDIYAQGGDTGALNNDTSFTLDGGHGGSVSISNGSLSIGGTVRLYGGKGGSSNGHATPMAFEGAWGGLAGSFTVTNSNVNLNGNLEISGGDGSDGADPSVDVTAGGVGRAGGVITINGGSLAIANDIIAHGGRGGNASRSGRHGNGGKGGRLTINGGQVTLGRALDLAGGQSGWGDIDGSSVGDGGGDGGTITLNGGAFTGSAAEINLRGGEGAPYYDAVSGLLEGPKGGNGGSVSVSAGEFRLHGSLAGGGGTGSSSVKTLMYGYYYAGDGGHGGQITVSGGLFSLDAAGASITLTGGNGGYLNHISSGGYGGEGGNGGTINVNGGTFSFAQGWIILTAGIGGAGSTQYAANGTHGTLTVAGGTLVTTTPGFLDTNLTGNLAVNSGVIRFTGAGGTVGPGGRLATALGGGLGAGATLEFDQAIAIGADLTVNSGGRLVFHDDATVTAGPTLTLNSGAIIDLYLGQAASSTLFVAAGAALTGPSAGPVTFNFHDRGDFAAGTYDLIDASSAGAIRYNWLASNFAVGSGIAGYTYSFAINGDVLQVTATAVPEPAAYAALAGALALAAALWRRPRGAA